MVALGVGWAALATDHSGSLMIHTILLPQTVPNVSHSIDFLFLQSVRQRPPRRPTKIFSGSTTANTRREAIKVEKKKIGRRGICFTRRSMTMKRVASGVCVCGR